MKKLPVKLIRHTLQYPRSSIRLLLSHSISVILFSVQILSGQWHLGLDCVRGQEHGRFGGTKDFLLNNKLRACSRQDEKKEHGIRRRGKGGGGRMTCIVDENEYFWSPVTSSSSPTQFFPSGVLTVPSATSFSSLPPPLQTYFLSTHSHQNNELSRVTQFSFRPVSLEGRRDAA